jgi:hypothetical protein
MRSRRMIEQVLLDRVPVEPGDRGQPPGDGGPGPAVGFQVAGEAFDVSPACLEEPQLMRLASGGVLAQVQVVGLAGQAAVASQEPG